MHKAVARLQSGARVPIENIFGASSLFHRYVRSYSRFARRGGQSVELHKRVLGRQDCTFTGSEYRYWVWDRPTWTVLVGRRGVEFDVSPELTPQQAWKLWQDYLRTMGL